MNKLWEKEVKRSWYKKKRRNENEKNSNNIWILFVVYAIILKHGFVCTRV